MSAEETEADIGCQTRIFKSRLLSKSTVFMEELPKINQRKLVQFFAGLLHCVNSQLLYFKNPKLFFACFFLLGTPRSLNGSLLLISTNGHLSPVADIRSWRGFLSCLKFKAFGADRAMHFPCQLVTTSLISKIS